MCQSQEIGSMVIIRSLHKYSGFPPSGPVKIAISCPTEVKLGQWLASANKMWVEVTHVISKWKHLIGGAQLQTAFFLPQWLWDHEFACGLCHPSSLGDQSKQKPLLTHAGHVAWMRNKPGWSHWDLKVVYYWSLTSSLLVIIEQRNPLKYIYLIILSSQVLFLEASYAHFFPLMSAKKKKKKKAWLQCL